MSNPKICYLCGTTENLTKEHIPPKSFFPKEGRGGINLITIWACQKCNASWKESGNYVRMMFSLLGAAAGRQSAKSKRILDTKVEKDFRRSTKLGESVMESLPKDLKRSPVSIKLDSDKMEVFFNAIVRGLYIKHTGNMLPITANINFFQIPFVNAEEYNKLPEEIRKGIILFGYEPLYDVIEDVFCYKFFLVPEIPHCSTWLIQLYDREVGTYIAQTFPV